MTRCGCKVVAWAVFLGGLTLAAAAQEPAPPAGAGEPGVSQANVGQEVARLNVTLKELVTLLRQQLAGQRIELLMWQVELKRDKLAPLENELRSARAAQEGAEAELHQLQLSQEQSTDSIANEFEGGDGSPEQREQMERMAEQMSRHFTLQIKLTKERIAALEQKIQVLEGDASTARAEVEHWEAMVERELQR